MLEKREAVYFKKSLLINRDAIFVKDIEPKGFNLIVTDGFLTRRTVEKVREILQSPERKDKMVSTNFEIANRYCSFSILRRWLNPLLINFFGYRDLMRLEPGVPI